MSAALWGGLFVLSLFHPHLREKWQWAGQVARGSVGWGERFRPVDSFDLALHTGMSIVFLVLCVRALRTAGS